MLPMPTRIAVALWLVVFLLLVPLAARHSFGDASDFSGNISLLAIVFLGLCLMMASWKLKKRLKKRMKRGLGRDVDDYELTSITTWMRIPDQAARAAKEAEHFDSDDVK